MTEIPKWVGHDVDRLRRLVADITQIIESGDHDEYDAVTYVAVLINVFAFESGAISRHSDAGPRPVLFPELMEAIREPTGKVLNVLVTSIRDSKKAASTWAEPSEAKPIDR